MPPWLRYFLMIELIYSAIFEPVPRVIARNGFPTSIKPQLTSLFQSLRRYCLAFKKFAEDDLW
jgi:hypothetical protein